MKTDRKILAHNSAWSLLNQLTRVVTVAIVMIALSRHFGPERFGSLAFGLAFVRIFAVIAAFGLDRILVRHFVESPADGRAILRGALRVKLGIALLSYASLLAIVFLLDPRDRLTMTIVCFAGGGLFFQAFDVFDYYFQAQNRFHLAFLGRTIPVVLSTAVKLIAVVMGAPLLVFAALETVEMALIAAALLSVYLLTRDVSPFVERSAPRPSRVLLREGFPLVLGSLAAMIYMRSDILMLGKMVGFQAVGLYSAAAQVTEAFAVFPMAFLPAVLPILLRWRQLGPEVYRQRYEALFLGAFLAGSVVAAGLTIAAPAIVRIVYGAAYVSSAQILVIHAWSAIFLYVAILQTGYDITEALTWFTAVRTAAGASINVALNFLLIPRFGAVGAAFATLVSLACSGFLLNALHPRTRPIFAMQLRAFLLVPLGRALRQAAAPIPRAPLVNSGSVAR